MSYSGLICTDVFTPLQACYSGGSALPLALNIPAASDQNQVEATAEQLLTALVFLNPSSECMESIEPFLCLHLFGLCDASGDLHTTLRGECRRLRDDVCSREWMTALTFLPPETLPVCESLPDQVEECTG